MVYDVHLYSLSSQSKMAKLVEECKGPGGHCVKAACERGSLEGRTFVPEVYMTVNLSPDLDPFCADYIIVYVCSLYAFLAHVSVNKVLLT